MLFQAGVPKKVNEILFKKLKKALRLEHHAKGYDHYFLIAWKTLFVFESFQSVFLMHYSSSINTIAAQCVHFYLYFGLKRMSPLLNLALLNKFFILCSRFTCFTPSLPLSTQRHCPCRSTVHALSPRTKTEVTIQRTSYLKVFHHPVFTFHTAARWHCPHNRNTLEQCAFTSTSV